MKYMSSVAVLASNRDTRRRIRGVDEVQRPMCRNENETRRNVKKNAYPKREMPAE